MEEVISTAARIAQDTGGWQGILLALGIILVGAVLVVLVKHYGGPFVLALKAFGTYLHSIKPSETTLESDGSHKEGTGAPAMPVDKDGKIPLNQRPPTDWS